MLQVRGPLMARRSYLPATVTNEIWRKDMKIIGAFVRQLGSAAPLFDATKAIYNAAIKQGYGKADTAAVNAVLEQLSRKTKRRQAK
jgi:3-hydroxyisobutyrate dehydrogenase-like beta-hydroxyacid dehydrogenase